MLELVARRVLGQAVGRKTAVDGSLNDSRKLPLGVPAKLAAVATVVTEPDHVGQSLARRAQRSPGISALRAAPGPRHLFSRRACEMTARRPGVPGPDRSLGVESKPSHPVQNPVRPPARSAGARLAVLGG